MNNNNTPAFYTMKQFIWLISTVLFLAMSTLPLSAQEQKLTRRKDDNKIIMGIVRAVDSDSFYINNYFPFVEYIANELHKTPELKVFGYKEIADSLMSNAIDIAIFSPYSYIDAKRRFGSLNLFAVPIKEGRRGYHSVIVCKKSKPYKNLGDLQGKKFAYVNSMSTSGYQIPRRAFLQYTNEHKLPDSVFSYIFAGSHGRAIELLAADSVEAIATYKEVFKKVKDKNRLGLNDVKIIGEEHFIPNNAYVFFPGLPAILRTRIKKIMCSAHNSPNIDTRRLFTASTNKMRVESWEAADDGSYNPLRELLKAKRLKPKISINHKASENVHHLVVAKHTDIVTDIIKHIKSKLDNSHRFFSEADSGFTSMLTLNLEFSTGSDDNIRLEAALKSSEFNKQISTDMMALKTIEKNLDNISSYISNWVLNQLPIRTKITQDTTNHTFSMPYGQEDGISTEYAIKLLKSDSVLSLGEPNIKIGKTETTFSDNVFYTVLHNEKAVKIVFHNTSTLQLQRNRTNKIKKVIGGFWDKLDNVWGVIGLAVAFITILLTTFFQNRKHKRFKNMLSSANGILKDHFEGKEIESRIVSLRADLGLLLENHQIKEIQYNLLVNKLSEIQNVVSKQNTISQHIKDEIEKIIADGKISEKEYQRLIWLINKN